MISDVTFKNWIKILYFYQKCQFPKIYHFASWWSGWHEWWYKTIVWYCQESSSRGYHQEKHSHWTGNQSKIGWMLCCSHSPIFTQQFQWQGKGSFEINFLDNRNLKNLTKTKVIHLCHQNCKNIFVFFLHLLFSLSIQSKAEEDIHVEKLIKIYLYGMNY